MLRLKRRIKLEVNRQNAILSKFPMLNTFGRLKLSPLLKQFKTWTEDKIREVEVSYSVEYFAHYIAIKHQNKTHVSFYLDAYP